MELVWMQNHRDLIEKMIKFGNSYAKAYQLQRHYGTEEIFSASQIQTFEYILESENQNEKMSEMAERLGVSRSTFSKNVKSLMDKEMLEKYHRIGNKKDIFVKPTEKGRKIYSAYTQYVCNLFFNDLFSMADEIPQEHKLVFGKILDCFSDALLWYGHKEHTPETLLDKAGSLQVSED